MKTTFLYILLFILFACVHSKPVSHKHHVLPAAELKPTGRTALHSDKGLELISSAAHFEFSFEGKECSLFVSIPPWLDHNYIQYTIDGEYQGRLRIDNKNTLPVVIQADKNGRHEVVIYKATEAHTGAVYIEKILAKGIQSVQPASLPLIEFIGNSITCGAAADTSDIPCGKGVYHDQHNAYLAYGPRLSRALGAQYILSSVSGIGVYRNWNSDGPAMPVVYERSGFNHQDPGWDFEKYTPDIVSMALGTNDLSNGGGVRPRLSFDSAQFVHEYLKFIQKVRSIYPSAKIALLSSPMIKGSKRLLLQNCLSTIRILAEKNSGIRISTFFFKPMEAGGCTGHPSVNDHAVMAKELYPFFKELLNNH